MATFNKLYCCIDSICWSVGDVMHFPWSKSWRLLLKGQFVSLVSAVVVLLFCEEMALIWSSPYYRDIAMRTSKGLDTSGGASGSPFLMWLVIDEEAKQGPTISEYNCRGFSAIHSALTWLYHDSKLPIHCQLESLNQNRWIRMVNVQAERSLTDCNPIQQIWSHLLLYCISL